MDLLDEILGQYEDVAASPSHQRIAEKLLADILARNARTGSKEVKKFEVSSIKGSRTSFVVIEIGMENDEGTAAAIYCRDYRHIMIGPRGGLALLNAKKKAERNGRWNVIHRMTS